MGHKKNIFNSEISFFVLDRRMQKTKFQQSNFVFRLAYFFFATFVPPEISRTKINPLWRTSRFAVQKKTHFDAGRVSLYKQHPCLGKGTGRARHSSRAVAKDRGRADDNGRSRPWAGTGAGQWTRAGP